MESCLTIDTVVSPVEHDYPICIIIFVISPCTASLVTSVIILARCGHMIAENVVRKK